MVQLWYKAGSSSVPRIWGTLTAMMMGTYLLVEVDHIPVEAVRILWVLRQYACGISPLTSPTLQRSPLRLFADIHRQWLIMS